MSFENLRSHLSKPSECCADGLRKCKFHVRNVTRHEASHCRAIPALASVLAADIAVGGYIGEPAGGPTAFADGAAEARLAARSATSITSGGRSAR
jgi:hypothetical protein